MVLINFAASINRASLKMDPKFLQRLVNKTNKDSKYNDPAKCCPIIAQNKDLKDLNQLASQIPSFTFRGHSLITTLLLYHRGPITCQMWHENKGTQLSIYRRLSETHVSCKMILSTTMSVINYLEGCRRRTRES